MDASDPLTRLTTREKEALRAWLAHKSAKEIALDFGITHHAVEKRLKMARVKLGAATSLEAARMLAQAEGVLQGYGQTVTATPDLPPAPPPGSLLRYRPIAIGGIAMSLALVLALALTTGGAPSAADEDLAAATGAASAAAGASANADKPARAAVIKLDPDMTPVFDKLDENASGYLERPESPFVAMAILDSTQQDGPETSAILGDKTDPEQVARFYAEADTDGDGRVSFREFHVWNSAQLAALGIDTSLELKITPLPQS